MQPDLEWEIVFAKTKMGMSDVDICSLIRYRWRKEDGTINFMQVNYINEILNMLSGGHERHSHAWNFGEDTQDTVNRIGDEFMRDLVIARYWGL